MKCVLRAWGQLKRGFELLALAEIYWVKYVFRAWGELKRGLRCWHWVKYVLRGWGRLKRGFEVLALGEICFEAMGAVEKGVRGVGTG